MHVDDYQIQPASESDVSALKQQIAELTDRLSRVEQLLKMPTMETKNAKKSKRYSFNEDEIKRAVEIFQKNRRNN